MLGASELCVTGQAGAGDRSFSNDDAHSCCLVHRKHWGLVEGLPTAGGINSAGTGACCQDRVPEVDIWNPLGRKRDKSHKLS